MTGDKDQNVTSWKPWENSCEPLSMHELLDRIFIIQTTFEQFVSNAPVLDKYLDLKKAAEEINDKLADLYQEIGKCRFEEQEERNR